MAAADGRGFICCSGELVNRAPDSRGAAFSESGAASPVPERVEGCFCRRSHAGFVLDGRRRGRAIRFRVRRCGEMASAFVIRFEGVALANLNRCIHRSLELD